MSLRSFLDPEKNTKVAARLARPFYSGWLALLSSCLLAILLTIGFVANVCGNENLSSSQKGSFQSVAVSRW